MLRDSGYNHIYNVIQHKRSEGSQLLSQMTWQYLSVQTMSPWPGLRGAIYVSHFISAKNLISIVVDRMDQQRYLISIAILAPLLALVLHVALNSPISPSPLVLPSSFFTSNNILQGVERLGEGVLEGPEDVCFDSKGTLYTATRDGWIKRKLAGNESWEEWRFVGGSAVLGIAISATGGLIVCDADKGLLKVGEEGVTILASEVDGTKIRFADEGIEALDGSIYFSDASSKFGLHDWFLDVLEAKPNGRLLKYDPSTNKASVVLTDLGFPNGVALSPTKDYVIVCETWKFRCLKHWLEGELKGETEVFIDNLPGGPDNINLAPDGSYWIALLQLRSGCLDSIHGWSAAKRMFAAFPKLVEVCKPMKRRATVINVGTEGDIRKMLDDSTGKVMSFVTTAVEHEGYLYLGSLGTNFVGRLNMNQLAGI